MPGSEVSMALSASGDAAHRRQSKDHTKGWQPMVPHRETTWFDNKDTLVRCPLM